MAVCMAVAFITTFIGSGLNLAVPAMEEEFHTGSAGAGWVVSIYMLTCASLAVPFGKIADAIGKRNILILGISLFALSSLAAVFSVGLWMVLCLRFVQAVGASMIFSTNVALILTTVDDRHRGKILGYVTGATYGGLALGPVLCGILNGHWGWRSIFLVAFCVSLGALLLAWGITKKGKEAKPKIVLNKSILKAMTLYASSLFVTLYGLSILSVKPYGWVMLLIGLAGCFIFLRGEGKSPVLCSANGTVRSPRKYRYANLATFINAAAVFSVIYFLSIYLQSARGFSSQTTGWILMASPVVQTLVSLWSGKRADSHSPQNLSAAGLLLCTFSLGSFLFLKEGTSLIWIVGALALLGAGTGLFASPNGKIIMGEVSQEGHGIASAVLATMRSVGHTISMAVASIGTILYMGQGSLKEASGQEIINAGRISFLLFTILCILGIFLALRKKV